MKTYLSACLWAVTVLLIPGFSTHADSPIITGAGATFPAPIYEKWFAEFQKKHPDTRVNYSPVGSGGGINQFSQVKTVDFGATDAPMSDEELAKVGAPVLHVPTVLGAVVLAYNLPTVGPGLKLTGEVVADIFLGKITQWNDGRIGALNPGKVFPKKPLLVVQRADGSGTTAVFTDYLSKVSSEWKNRVGVGKKVSWPTGLGAKGNEGVTAQIQQSGAEGAVGFIELAYAEKNSLSVALIKNRAGKFVAPSHQAVSAAASVKMPDDFRISITDSPTQDAYPISAFTYLLVWKEMPKEKGQKIVNLLKWALSDGQQFAKPLSYAPLPPAVAKQALTKVAAISLK